MIGNTELAALAALVVGLVVALTLGRSLALWYFKVNGALDALARIEKRIEDLAECGVRPQIKLDPLPAAASIAGVRCEQCGERKAVGLLKGQPCCEECAEAQRSEA